MRILITGGSGFIGCNLIDHFVRQGADVLNLDWTAPRNPAHALLWKQIDLLDRRSLQAAVTTFSPEVVLHFGARTDLDGRTVDDYAANTVGVENIIEALKGQPALQRVIFASSRLVCRIGYQPLSELDYCPTTPYGESKVMGEKLVRAAAPELPCSWLIVRPTSIWGPWFDVPYKTFFFSILKRQYFHPGRSTVLKSFGYVGNTVYQLQRLLDAPIDMVHRRTFYLADYPPIDVAQMANAIQRAFGGPPIRTLNLGMLRMAALCGDLLKALGWRNPPLTSFRLNNLLTPMVHDLGPLRAVVGDLPYTMEEGVYITAAWIKGAENVG